MAGLSPSQVNFVCETIGKDEEGQILAGRSLLMCLFETLLIDRDRRSVTKVCFV